MRWPRIIFLSLILALLVAFGHYTLPQRDIVRITDTEIIRTELTGWSRYFYASAQAGEERRDVRLINTNRPNGNVSVYRNEDTGFGWPPYFKFASQDVQAQALDLASDSENPRWVAITHYGWRNNYFSAYPNAIRIVEVDGPDVQLIPWLNIVILVGLLVFLFFLWRIWERFEARVLAPASDGIAVTWAKAKDKLSGRR